MYSRRRAAIWLFSATLLATLAWAIWEVGLDWWALSARGSLLVIIGMLLLPFCRWRPDPLRESSTASSVPLIATLGISAAVAVAAVMNNPHELDGSFSNERMAVSGDPIADGVDPGEWVSYGRQTGEEIWRSRLPAGGQATPSTYLGADGRQYLVVVAGGHGSTGTKAGDAIIAYALPKG